GYRFKFVYSPSLSSKAARLCLVAMLSLGVAAPKDVFANETNVVLDEMKLSYDSSRVDHVEAAVENCAIMLRRKDQSTCSVGHRFWKFEPLRLMSNDPHGVLRVLKELSLSYKAKSIEISIFSLRSDLRLH
ncbi:MAG: hypothetical protein WBV62_15905, partial [Roseobacter sp.]